MPLYEYECDACRHRFEIIQKYSDGPPDACPKCGKGPLQRQFSSPAIQFKGTGWYITDYPKKSSTDAGSSKASTDKSEKSDSAKSETKSETKSESTPKSDTPKTSAKD